MNLDLFQSLRVVSLATRTNFRGITTREVALFKGSQGWAEFSPFLEYDDQESRPWLECAIEAATTPPPKLFHDLVKVNATIPALDNKDEIARLVDRYPGCSVFKVKIGTGIREDIARLATVAALVPGVKLRADVNGLWNLSHAIENIKAIESEIDPLEYIEQPVASLEDLRELRSKITTKICGDEIIRKSVDPFKLDLTDAVDLIMLKVQPLGGIARCHAIANHHKLPVVISSALESAVGISYGLTLAASFADLHFDSGLATGSLLAQNVAQLEIIDGAIEVRTVDPDFASVQDVAAERYEWWKNRIMRIAQQIG
jgi:O-succinylbenzoate synthase